MAKRQEKKLKKKKIKSPKAGEKSIAKPVLSEKPHKQGIPVYNFLEAYDINTELGLINCLDDLLNCLEDGYFLRWEAVVRIERGLPLTGKQGKAFDEIINFFIGDEDKPILYIDEIPRPSESWFETLRKIVPKLILDPFTTYEIHNEIYYEELPRLMECLDEYAQDLSLPDGITSPIDVIPEEIRHRLWLQYSFDVLSGLGQEEELTLENDVQNSWRIKGFIKVLKEYKNSVKYFDLTIETLLNMVKLPMKDEKILIESMLEKLGMKTVSEKLYEYL